MAWTRRGGAAGSVQVQDEQGARATAPPKKPPEDADDSHRAGYNIARQARLSQRICVEYAIAEPKQW